jgi:1-deoxy-D-xylulose-5-phosphate synthase
MVLPDSFLDHDSPHVQYDRAGLNAQHIVAQVLATMGHADVQAPVRA